MNQLIELDKSLLIFFNSFHTPWLDPIILILTKTFVWIPLYLVLLYLIFKNYKKESWIILIAITIAIVLSDQITSSLMKPFFERLRPSHNPALEGVIHLVKNTNGTFYKGGLYGFASSHAANTFATAMFFWLLFRSRYKRITWLFLWAVLLTYTRIYLGVHYPGDILVGAIIGLLSAWAGYFIYLKLNEAIQKQSSSK